MRLRAAAKRPSAASVCFEPLDRREVLAETEPLERKCPETELALRRVQLGTPEHVDPLAVGEVELERVEGASRDRGGRQAPSSGSLSVKKTLAQFALRRGSVTSPSIHSVGSRASQSETPLLKPATVKTFLSP